MSDRRMDDDMGADTQGNAGRAQVAIVPSQLSVLTDAQFDACMDRLHLLLAAHFSALGVTAISQIQERKSSDC